MNIYVILLYSDELHFAVGLQTKYRDFNDGQYISKCSLLNANIWLSPQAHLALLPGVLSSVQSRYCKPGANLMMSCHVGICSAILIYVLLHKPIEYHSHDSCRKFIERCVHDDVIKWKHFPRNWSFVREIHRSPVNFPHKGQWRGALMFSLIYAWINDWVNNREAGDLRRQHGHYDVIVMYKSGLPVY